MRSLIFAFLFALALPVVAQAQTPVPDPPTPGELRQEIRQTRADVQKARTSRCYPPRGWHWALGEIPVERLKGNLRYVQNRRAHWRGHVSRCPKAVGKLMARKRYGWTGYQWRALRTLWNYESGWNPTALNPSSGACGIPQSITCPYPLGRSRKIVVRQIRWGLDYINGRYGSPSGALSHFYTYNWY